MMERILRPGADPEPREWPLDRRERVISPGDEVIVNDRPETVLGISYDMVFIAGRREYLGIRSDEVEAV